MKKLFLLLFFIPYFGLSQEEISACGFNENELPPETFQLMKDIPNLIQQKKLRKSAIDDFYFCRVVVDVDFTTFQRYNGDTLQIKQLVADMIQKTSLIYEKEIQTKLILTYVNIWKEQSKDPYNNISDIFTMLNNLRTAYSNNSALSRIPSDVVMYLPTKSFSGAGGVASGKFNVSPWQGISTIAHEIGHNFGSPHTQSCNWSGGALDYCYAVEGSCYSDALENINGTIMSYCNRRFNTFHPQCIALMSANAASRYQKIRAITETVKLNENYAFNANTFLDWNPVVFSENYVLEFASDAEFKNIVFKDTTFQAYATMPFLKKNQSYFLRIRSQNRLGVGQWSNTMKITTPANLLETPKLLSPANNSIDVNGLSLNLNFEAISGVTEYQLQYVTFSSSNTNVHFDFTGTTRRIATNSLAIGLTSEAVSWRVRSVRGSEFGAWSEPFVMWLRPNAANLDLTQQAINGYPTSFPLNFFGNSGNNLQVNLKVSEKADYSNPIVNKTYDLSQFPNTNYPFLLQNLKSNTTYYVKFEERNLEEQNIIGIPKGLVRFSEKNFKTGTEALPSSFSYFTNGNIANLSRTIRKVVFNQDFAFIQTNEGIIRMKTDGTDAKIFNRSNTRGIISNTLSDIKTDSKGDLWILTTVSKRLKFQPGNVFPKTTYRLARLNPTTLETIEATDFNGQGDSFFSTFDAENKYLTNNSNNIHKIVKDSTQSVFNFDQNTSFSSIQWGKDDVWYLTYNNNRAMYEVKNLEITSQKVTTFSRENSILAQNISQIFLDSKGSLWVSQSASNYLLKWTKEAGFQSVSYNLGVMPRIVGEFNGTLYLFVVNGLNRELYSFNGTNLKKIETISYVSTSGNFEIDKTGKIWFWQTDKILRINPCGNIPIPTLQASKQQILKGENIELRAEGCTSVQWSFSAENQAIQTQTVLNKNTLSVNPTINTTYRAKCIDTECVSEFSNSIEANVLSLSVRATDKNKYCTNENISINALIGGKFGTNNQLRAVFSNGRQVLTSAIFNDNGLKVATPKAIQNGKYWLKIQSSEPFVSSSDSVELSLFQAPTAQISGLTEMFLLDTAKVNITLTGTPPFKITYQNESQTLNNFSFTKNFYPTEPLPYTLSISNLSDANCAIGEIISKDLNVKVSLNPKYQGLWVQNYPSPFENTINIDVYNKPGKTLFLDLYNFQGKLIFKKELPIGSYLDKHKIDVTDLSSGFYFLKINTGNRQEVRKIVK